MFLVAACGTTWLCAYTRAVTAPVAHSVCHCVQAESGEGLQQPVSKFMTTSFRSVTPDTMAIDALQVRRQMMSGFVHARLYQHSCCDS